MGMEASGVLQLLSLAMLAVAVPVFIALQFQTAPYGRYSAAFISWEVLINGRVAWVLQELPALVVALSCWVRDPPPRGSAQTLLLLLFCFHYANRALVFPMRMRAPKPTPLSVFLMAFFFCCFNGYEIA
jgi:hypothetical protein